MPFNPDDYLAKKEASTANASSNAPAAFNPDAYLAGKGIQTLPNDGNIQDGATAAQSFSQTHPVLANAMNAAKLAINPANYFMDKEIQNGGWAAAANAAAVHLGQGATLGLNDEASSAISALAPGAADQPYQQKYVSDRDKMRKQIADTAQSHPVISAISELVSAAPITALTAGSGALANAGLSGLMGFGKSNKDTLGQTALDTAIPAAASLGLSALANGKAVTKYITDKYKAFFNPEAGEAVIDKLNPANVGVTVSPRPNGDFEIKFAGEGDKLGQAYKIGKEDGKLLSNPNTQAKITDEVNHVFGSDENPGIIPTHIAQAKQDLGVMRDNVLKDKGSLATDVEGSFKSAWDKIKTYDTGGDVEKERAIEDLKNRMITLEQNLRAKSPTASLNDVPLLNAFQTKQELGEKIFGKSQLYKKADDARGIVQGLWGDLGKTVADTHPEVKTLTDAFSALYKLENNAINSPKQVEALTSPTANVARKAYKDFIKPFMELEPNTRAALMPNLQEYLATGLPTTLTKASILKAVDDAGMPKASLPYVIKKVYGSRFNAAAGLGALSNNTPAALQSLAPAASMGAASPALNALTVPNEQPQGALRPMQ